MKKIRDHLQYLILDYQDCKDCPNWPPDYFAVASYFLDLSGSYTEMISIEGSKKHYHKKAWLKSVHKMANKWRKQLEKSVGDPAPSHIRSYWKKLLSIQEKNIDEILSDPIEKHIFLGILFKMLAIADETSAGIGIQQSHNDALLDFGETLLTSKSMLTVCDRINIKAIRVLPKQHTPQCGITLRSLTQHLCLLKSQNTDAKWLINTRAKKKLEVFNLLLCPWPLEINQTDFRKIPHNEHTINSMPREKFGFFSYERPSPEFNYEDVYRFDRKIRSCVEEAEKITGTGNLHGIVFPELSLLPRELLIIKEIAYEKDLLVCAGVQEPRKNYCEFDFFGLSMWSNNDSDVARIMKQGQIFTQNKHHRWYLERNQILSYSLGGILPTNINWWEYIDIQKRKIHFATLADWLTICPLICEDLARQEPISNVIRTVGPSLVIALLMDGPQIVERWPARYATILAEDPGASVLTMTSLGMSNLSKPLEGESRSRVVGLWKDIESGFKELVLEENSEALVLCLSPHERTEYTADGRHLSGKTSHPVFSGLHQICVSSRDRYGSHT